MKRWYFAFQVVALAISAGAFGAANSGGSSVHGALGPLGATVAVGLVALTLIGLRFSFPASGTDASLFRRLLHIGDRSICTGVTDRGRVLMSLMEGVFLGSAALALARGWPAAPFAFGALFASTMELFGMVEALLAEVGESSPEVPPVRT